MFDDDQHERRMARNQLIAFILLAILFVVYLKWMETMAPPPPPADAPAPVADGGSTAEEPAPGTLPAEAVQTGGWATLPPVAETEEAADEVVLESERAKLSLTLTRIGARLKTARVILGEEGRNSWQLVPTPPPGVSTAEAAYPLGLRFTDPALGEELNRRRWDVVQQTPESVTFALTLPGTAEIRKTIAFGDAPHVLEIQVEYRNLEETPRALGIDQTPAYALYWAPDIVSDEVTRMMPKQLIWRVGNSNEIEYLKDLAEDGERSMPNTRWVAAKSAYFAVALRPEFEGARGWAMSLGPDRYQVGVTAPAMVVAPGEARTDRFRAYVGPNHLEQLAAGWETLPSIQRFYGDSTFGRPMNAFAVFLLNILNWFHSIIPNYGVAIILLTVLVRMAVFPLTIKQIKSMKKMQLLAPEMEALKEKYGNDQQELSRKMMELYRERGVNPMGGCLPLVVQMPVFFALYRMLSTAFELRGAGFMLWIDDLSRADHLFHMPWMRSVPILGYYLEWFNLLPIVMVGVMVLNTKLTPMSGAMQNPQQKTVMTLMPIMFGVFMYTLPSGLCLYILTSTLLGIGQQMITQRIKIEVETEPKKKAMRKRRSFYTAAKARQRRRALEARQDAKTGMKRNDSARVGGTVPGAKDPRKGEKTAKGGTKHEKS